MSDVLFSWFLRSLRCHTKPPLLATTSLFKMAEEWKTWAFEGPFGLPLPSPPLFLSVHSQPRPPASELEEPAAARRGRCPVGDRLLPAATSPPGFTGGAGVRALEVGGLGRSRATAQPERPALPAPPRGKNRRICPDPSEILLFFAVPSPRPSPSRGGRRRAELAREKPGLGRRRNEGPGAGGFPPALPPPTGAENVICCAFQARFPGVTSPSRPGRGSRQRGEAGGEGTPRGSRRGAGAGAVPGKGADSGSRGGGGGAWPMERRGPGRRARPPAFKRETARCPALGAPSADRATQGAARALLSVPLPPRRARRLGPRLPPAPRVESAGRVCTPH